jgi:hypothetical protein
MDPQHLPPDPEDLSGRPKMSRKAIVVALVVVLVLGGQMAFGVRLLWKKWHEPPPPAVRPETRAVR